MSDTTASPLRMAVRTFGRGAPLVLFHGGMGSWRHWVRNLDALAAHYTVHALDLIGYGDSPALPKSTPHDEYIAAVADGVRAIVGSKPFRLAGFSFGGVAATMTAAVLSPQVVRLSLMGVGGFGPNDRLDMQAIPPGAHTDEPRRSVLRHNLLQLMLAHPDSVTDESIEIYDENFRQTRFDGRGFSNSHAVPESLPRIPCPVQFIYGDRDSLAHATLAQRESLVRQRHANVRFDVIPAAGHWVQYEAAAATNRLLLQFLAD